MNAAHKRIAERGLDYEVDGAAKRTKVNIKVRAKFDRAGGSVDGVFTYDKETGIVTVREKGAKKAYQMRMSDVVDMIARRGLFGVRDDG